MQILQNKKDFTTTLLIIIAILFASMAPSTAVRAVNSPDKIGTYADDAAFDDSTDSEELYDSLQQVIDIISRRSLEPVEESELLKAAIEGVVDSLDDPYADFIDAEQLQQMMERFDGSRYSGVGMQIGQAENGVQILEVFPGYPADEAGLKPGDVIVGVDKQCTENLPVSEVGQLLRGPESTEVSIEVKRDDEYHDKVTLQRENIARPTVRSALFSIKDRKIGYLAISEFGENTPNEVAQALSKLQSAEGILVDVRNNPGGMLHSALDSAEHFVPPGLLLKSREREQETRFTGDSPGIKQDVVVLMNGHTASGGEILAGVLRDRLNALLVGTESFGKGTVQSIYNIDGSGLRLTTAEFVFPAGQQLSNLQLHPDIFIRRSGRTLSFSDRIADKLVLEPGEQSEEVFLVKRRLQQMGFYEGELNEVYDSHLRRAVALFQRSQDIRPNGILDEQTLDAIFDIDWEEHLLGSLDIDLEEVQQQHLNIRLDRQQLRSLEILWQKLQLKNEDSVDLVG